MKIYDIKLVLGGIKTKHTKKPAVRELPCQDS